MLCGCCSGLEIQKEPHNGAEYVRLHQNYAALDASARKECKLCSLLKTCLLHAEQESNTDDRGEPLTDVHANYMRREVPSALLLVVVC